MGIYDEYRRTEMCVAHEDLEVGGTYAFTYYDSYEGVIKALSEDKENVQIKITKVCTEDMPAYSVGDTLNVFDINIKKKIAPPPPKEFQWGEKVYVKGKLSLFVKYLTGTRYSLVLPQGEEDFDMVLNGSIQRPALVLGGLDPQKYPEVVLGCGCKFIDGTVTDMCEAHEIDMHRGN